MMFVLLNPLKTMESNEYKARNHIMFVLAVLGVNKHDKVSYSTAVELHSWLNRH